MREASLPAESSSQQHQSSPAENPLEKEFDRAVKQDQHVWGQVIDLTDENHDPLSPEQLADQTADRDLDNADAQTIKQISNSIGTEAGLLTRLVPRLAPPNDPPNWEEVFEGLVARLSGMNDHDWSRPSRRWVPKDLYLPRRSQEGLGTLVVAIDTSGSVSDGMLHAFHDAVDDILCKYTETEVYVIYCDTRVSGPHYYPPGSREISREHRFGRGGTYFDPPFKLVENEDIQPDVFVYLTDMYGYVTVNEPSYPVVWCMPPTSQDWYDKNQTFQGKPHWGEKVVVEIDAAHSYY